MFRRLPLFLLSLFCLPLFHFLLLCLSLVIFFLRSFFSFLFALLCSLVCVSFFLIRSSLLLFHEKNHIRILHQKFFPINPLSFLLCRAFSFKSLFLVFVVFPHFKLCFLFNINALSFKKKDKLKNANFWSRGGLQQNVFFF